MIQFNPAALGQLTRNAQIWFNDLITKKLRSIKNRIFIDPRHPPIGEMILFKYDAKYKDTLPYWDAYPLVFPINFYTDGFLGLNMHYLPLKLRLRLFNELLQYRAIHNQRNYLNISYALLKNTVSNRLFEPTIHRYLANHIRTELFLVPHSMWKTALYLPLAKWKNSKPPGL